MQHKEEECPVVRLKAQRLKLLDHLTDFLVLLTSPPPSPTRLAVSSSNKDWLPTG